MQGKITCYDESLRQGALQTSDGAIVSFDERAVSSLNEDILLEKMLVDFSLDDEGNVISIKPVKDPDSDTNEFLYKVPDSIPFVTDDSVYEIIDAAKFRFTVEGRNEIELKRQLTVLSQRVGGNALTGYSIEKFVKNSIGFSIDMLRASATACVVGIRSEEGTSTLYDLKHVLNHEAVSKYHQGEESRKSRQVFLKIASIILFLIFCAGFVLSLE
ncbi:MAG: hypothetical protein ACI4NE_06955 [Succinivibrio sp.]